MKHLKKFNESHAIDQVLNDQDIQLVKDIFTNKISDEYLEQITYKFLKSYNTVILPQKI